MTTEEKLLRERNEILSQAVIHDRASKQGIPKTGRPLRMLPRTAITFPPNWTSQQRRAYLAEAEDAGLRTSPLQEDSEDGQSKDDIQAGMLELQSRCETQRRNLSASNDTLERLQHRIEDRNRTISEQFAVLAYHEKRNDRTRSTIMQLEAKIAERIPPQIHPDKHHASYICSCGVRYLVFRE